MTSGVSARRPIVDSPKEAVVIIFSLLEDIHHKLLCLLDFFFAARITGISNPMSGSIRYFRDTFHRISCSRVQCAVFLHRKGIFITRLAP